VPVIVQGTYGVLAMNMTTRVVDTVARATWAVRGGINPALSVPADASQIPSYFPAIRRVVGQQFQLIRTFLGDGGNNVWVLINMPGVPTDADVYDVIDRQGELIDRVQLPTGRHLLGFGPHVLD
jgi:hypothetical protein